MHIPHISTWHDFRLSWNPEDYDDLDYIELSLTEIWRPELILYERLSKHSDESFETETDVVKVYNTGKVNWVTIASTRSFCSINVENFPKDKHTCDVTFTTWLHRDNEQKLQILGKMDPCEIEHLTWRLTFTGLGGNDSLYRCHQYLQNQSYVRYIANLERLDTHFGMSTFVVPNIFISLVSVFTLCFPRGDSNGPAFGMMCLLALIIQLGTLYQVIPDTAFCKVGQSIATLTILVAVETFFSVINMGIVDLSYIGSESKDLLKLLRPKTRVSRACENIAQIFNKKDDNNTAAQSKTTDDTEAAMDGSDGNPSNSPEPATAGSDRNPSNSPEPATAGSDRNPSNRPEPARDESDGNPSNSPEPARDESDRNPSNSPEPARDESDRNPSNSPEPARDESDRNPSNSPEPARDESDRTPSNSPEPARDESDRNPSNSPEPARDESDRNPSNSPKPVDVNNGNKRIQDAINRAWLFFKILLSSGFFVAILWISITLVCNLSNE